MKKMLMLLLMALSIAGSVHAAPVDPALEAMETLRRSFAALTDFSAEITQEKQ